VVAAISLAARARRRRRDDDDDQAPRKRGLSGLLDAVQASGGKVVNLSQRKLARRIGVSRRTLERAMRDAAAAGAVMLETGKTGTRLALA
jgi:predicted DNA-binding transcriptional regulator YafY